MARRMPVENHLEAKELEARYKGSPKVEARTHWQVILLVGLGRSVQEVAQVVGYTPAWVRALVHRYNRLGPEALGDQRGSAGGGNTLWDAASREELARALEQPVPPELGGGVWNGVKVALWMSQKWGQTVHRQRGQEALRWLGYSCQKPRPRHIRADEGEQEAFKKSWQRA